ncbi:MAG: hypothetical protein ACOY7J_10955 [Pseudomonadota bacterium]
MHTVTENTRGAIRILLLASVVICTGACSLLESHPSAGTTASPLPQCQQELQQLQRTIDRSGVNDAQYVPVQDFPTYRSNRFWSSFAADELNPEQQQYWRRQLHTLGMDSLRIEARNLPTGALPFSSDTFFARCDEPLWQASLQQPLSPQQLQIPDSYSDLQRFFGIYALTSRGALGSIRQYQQEMRERISGDTAFDADHSVLYQPQIADDGSDIRPTRDPLGIPQFSASQLQALLNRHAPQWQVEQRSDADRIGAARWQREKRRIDGEQPLVYAYPSYVRSRQGVLLQLNYTAWFAERPKPKRFDWYGGALDGLIWRVTLRPDGGVLFYDSIHPCGCYHSLHRPQNSALDIPAGKDEPLLVFDSPLSDRHANPVLLVQADTHYLLKVMAQPDKAPQALNYRLAPYDDLRSLPAGAAGKRGPRHRNWFDADGLIAASARFERFFLWPLGVPSAGAMRQQGHHAIAFVGRRHFDEAWLEDFLGLR